MAAVSSAAVALLLALPPQGAEVGPQGSPATWSPMGRHVHGLTLSGGVALLAPFYNLHYAFGTTRKLDVTARYETVVGLWHHPRIGVRWAAAELGRWDLGVRASFGATFFGLKSEHTELTSRLLFVGGIGASGPVSERLRLSFGIDGDFDFVELIVIEGEREVAGRYRFAATTPRLAMMIGVNPNTALFAAVRVRVPTDTLLAQPGTFLVVPYLEVGGSWSWPSNRRGQG